VGDAAPSSATSPDRTLQLSCRDGQLSSPRHRRVGGSRAGPDGVRGLGDEAYLQLELSLEFGRHILDQLALRIRYDDRLVPVEYVIVTMWCEEEASNLSLYKLAPRHRGVPWGLERCRTRTARIQGWWEGLGMVSHLYRYSRNRVRIALSRFFCLQYL
jgi:hypothetical protein